MNNEIIPVSPVMNVEVDETPRKMILSKRKATTINAFKNSISILLTLNLLVSSFLFAQIKFSTEAISDMMLYGVLYGGMLEEDVKITTENGPKPSIPVSADPVLPIPDEAKESTEIPENNEIAEAFAKLYDYDLSLVPEGLYPIIPYDLSAEADGELRLFNDTGFNVDMEQLAFSENKTEGIGQSEEPVVLIIHTHGTEGYSEPGVLGYSDTYNVPRSYDVTKNVIHIGRLMAKIMNEYGVNTVQCDVMHDAESYLGAYERSAATVREYLKRYPSIKYVFDIHRDSVLMEDKTKTRPITIANGETAAQIMTVVGSDELGTYHPEWENNLRFASKLQVLLNKDHLGLARSVCLRGSSYNQELAPCSLLFEIGSCGNTIKEAEVAAKILAAELCKLIKEGW